MKELKDLIKEYKTPINEKNFRSERDELITRFTNTYNQGTEDKFKITEKRMAIKLAHIKTGELDWFYKECSNKENFGRFLNWAIKSI